MSEYQYYEFQAIDRPLDRTAQEALRSISSRARITAKSFTNHYEWGDLKGDPRKLMERWFDLHLYFANWGTRRLMMRLPKRFLDPAQLASLLSTVDGVGVETWTSGDDLIVDICREEVEQDDWAYWHDDDSDRLAALAPLRADVLSGDLRLFHLLWLAAVQDELVADDDVEPLPGIAPLTPALGAFADFFDVDPDLVAAAAETGVGNAAVSGETARATVAAIPESEKTELLFRLVEGDPYVAAELMGRLRKGRLSSATCRAAGALRKRAQEIAEARKRAGAEREEAERRRKAEEAEKARQTRIDALKRRGASVWQEVEQEIARRNASGYDRAASLLSDLQTLASQEGSLGDFRRRLASIHERHEKKVRFIERLGDLAEAGAPSIDLQPAGSPSEDQPIRRRGAEGVSV